MLEHANNNMTFPAVTVSFELPKEKEGMDPGEYFDTLFIWDFEEVNADL